MGKEAALEEHKIILDALRRGTRVDLTATPENQIMRSIDTINELAYDEVVPLNLLATTKQGNTVKQ